MQSLFFKLLLFVLVCSTCEDAAAQVRVRRWRSNKEGKHETRPKQGKEPVQRSRHENVQAIVATAIPGEARAELDARFYVQWNNKKHLDFEDFLNNRNLYNKFISAKDTDLTRVIYPDYRDFYRKLNERAGIADGRDDKWWRERVERVLKEKADSIDAGYASRVLSFADISFSISIDSPAASVITIYPVIYAINETTYYYNISALFSRYESWMIVKSRDILEHEQIHFDIFELYARRMRKHLVETLKQNYADGAAGDISKDITPVYEQMYQQLNDMQLEFDKETMALTSTDRPLLITNSKWKGQLRVQLESLKEYAIAEGYVILK